MWIMCLEWSDMSSHELLLKCASTIKNPTKHVDLEQSTLRNVIEYLPVWC